MLLRYDFPFKRLVDASVDLPFALPTAVAGLTLATVYSENGWIGSLFAPFGIKIAFTRLGVGMVLLMISLLMLRGGIASTSLGAIPTNFL